VINIIGIKKWMKNKIITVEQEKSIVDAAKVMAKNNVGCAITLKDKKPVGILTSTDIIKRVVSKDISASETKVKEIMSKNLITCPSDSTFMEVSGKMRKYGIKHIVVTDKGAVVGVITSTDILKLVSGSQK
jgi:predicted transcriptional regulator